MKLAKSGGYDTLLVFEIARFSRDFLGGMEELAQLTRNKVKIADTQIGVQDLDTPHGQMMVSVHLMGAHQDIKKLSINSKRGLKGKVLAGFSSGGKPAYGMQRNPVYSETDRDVDGRPKRIGVRIEPDPSISPVVVRIFETYADGANKHEIARSLNKDKIPSRDKGGVHDGRMNDGQWCASSVHKILANEIYVGDRIWNKHSRKGAKLKSGKKAMVKNDSSEWQRVEGYATPTVDRELWGRVQAKLAEDSANRTTAGKHRQYLLSGLIRCGACDGHFVIGSVLRGVRRYRCSRRATRGPEACDNKATVPQEALERKVRHVLDSVAKDPEQLADLVREHNARVDEHNQEHSGEADRLLAKRAEAKRALDRLVQAIEAGGSSSTVMQAIQRREREIQELDEAIERARQMVQPRIEPRAKVDDFRVGTASVFTGDFVQDKQLIEHALDRIRVAREGSIGLQFRPDTMFRLVSWESTGESGFSPQVTRRWLASVEKVSQALSQDLRGEASAPATATESTAGIDLKNNAGVPSGI